MAELHVIEQTLAKTGPQQASQFQVDEIAVSRGEGVKPHPHASQKHGQTPIKPRTHTHPLSGDCGYIYLGHSRGENLKTKERARTRRQPKMQGLGELVANAGDGSSLVTRRATHHCLPLLHPQCFRQFSLPVWLRDLFPLLILLLPTKDKLNEDGSGIPAAARVQLCPLRGDVRGLAVFDCALYTWIPSIRHPPPTNTRLPFIYLTHLKREVKSVSVSICLCLYCIKNVHQFSILDIYYGISCIIAWSVEVFDIQVSQVKKKKPKKTKTNEVKF